MRQLSMFILSIFIASVLFCNIWTHLKLNETTSSENFIQRYYNWFSSTLFIKEYAFFCPDIVDGYVMVILKKDSTEMMTPLPIEFNSYEMKNKMLSVMHKFYEIEEMRDVLSFSFSRHFFEQNPGVDSMVFTLSQYKLPSMLNYRNGEEAYIEPIYIQDFYLNNSFHENTTGLLEDERIHIH